MSSANSPEPHAAAMTEPPAPAEPAISRKSYRRKYRKIMVNFEEKMRESNALFKDEQRIFDISQRLAEQTDQMLQMLVELNTHPHVPGRLRFDLRGVRDYPMKHPQPRAEYTEEQGHSELRKARSQLQNGEISAAQYRELEDKLKTSPEFTAQKDYHELVKIAPINSTATSRDNDVDSLLNGFLTAKQRDQYIQGLDAYLDGTSTTTRPHVANSLGTRNAEKSSERERETQLRNPVSVYNWLRKHQPQVFLQDNESTVDKPTKSSVSRTSKRNMTRDSAVKLEPEMYDEDGVAIEQGSLSRGKRKRNDEDTGYRPKGGNSRPYKKRDSTAAVAGGGKKGKKMSVDSK